MPVITLYTQIAADPETCCRLSRSVDLHVTSLGHTGETAVAGVMSGLVNLGDSITWRAKHLGVWQKLTVHITEMDPPRFFADEMLKGAFKRFRHEHRFTPHQNGTLMTDIFDYTSPFGYAGKLLDALFLKKYMTRLLQKRNEILKVHAELDYKT